MKKFAIRHLWRGEEPIRYLARDGDNSPLVIIVDRNTYDTVGQAVATIVQYAVRFPSLYKQDALEIVGVELQVINAAPTVRLIREIPLKTL